MIILIGVPDDVAAKEMFKDIARGLIGVIGDGNGRDKVKFATSIDAINQGLAGGDIDLLFTMQRLSKENSDESIGDGKIKNWNSEYPDVKKIIIYSDDILGSNRAKRIIGGGYRDGIVARDLGNFELISDIYHNGRDRAAAERYFGIAKEENVQVTEPMNEPGASFEDLLFEEVGVSSVAPKDEFITIPGNVIGVDENGNIIVKPYSEQELGYVMGNTDAILGAPVIITKVFGKN